MAEKIEGTYQRKNNIVLYLYAWNILACVPAIYCQMEELSSPIMILCFNTYCYFNVFYGVGHNKNYTIAIIGIDFIVAKHSHNSNIARRSRYSKHSKYSIINELYLC